MISADHNAINPVLRQFFDLLAAGWSRIFCKFFQLVQDCGLNPSGQLADGALGGRRYLYLIGHCLSATQLLAQLAQTDGAIALGLLDGGQCVVNVKHLFETIK